jgi:hypothetical protein
VWCATGGDLSRVSEILTAHPEMVDQGDEDGESARPFARARAAILARECSLVVAVFLQWRPADGWI